MLIAWSALRNDRVLDVGCGVGTLGHALMTGEDCPRGVRVGR
jgi:16S rRNA G1207 methylase RsmC